MLKPQAQAELARRRVELVRIGNIGAFTDAVAALDVGVLRRVDAAHFRLEFASLLLQGFDRTQLDDARDAALEKIGLL